MSDRISLKRACLLLVAGLLMFSSAFAQMRIRGKVTDKATGNPLPAVNVYIQGTTTGTATDANGMYSISASRNSVLVFSSVGYAQQEITVGNTTTINVALVPSATELGEVVVTALGIKREQKALGYAISTIDSKELVKVGSTNFGSALYGKASGVRISTAPGGATSAVAINIRGMNSINFSSQPLIIVDGIPIRNGEANNSGYWGDQRIRGNGLIDINPEDIQDLSILKGASASALYGSEAANGVVVITTKKGTRRQGLGVDVNYTYQWERPAFSPPFQNLYGPGYDLATNQTYFGADEDGWVYEDLDGDGTPETPRPIYRSYAQFGPAFDGRQVIGWDNKMHPYVAQPDNWNNLFRTGMNSIANVAVNKAGDFGSFRFSFTRNDYKGVQRGGDHNKNNFNVNTTLKLAKNLEVDLGVNYINQYTLNRPYKISRITNNYGGFLSRFDDAQWYLDNYQTSKGYRFRTANQPSATPDENLQYNMRATDLLDFFWRTLAQKNEEHSDRLISNMTMRWTILPGLTMRGRIANDFTDMTIEQRSPNTVPLAIGNSGGFSMSQSKYAITYGDVLFSYNKKLTDDIGLIVNAGYQARRETYKYNSAGTNGGLSTENWFHLNASVKTKNGNASYTEFLKYAFLGTASLSYKDYLFFEFTGRRESSSTLPPASNTFFYPSVNASFLFSDALNLPEAINYGKLRVAWGIVGNAPPLYAANNAFSQGAVNGIVYNSVSSSYGNDGIRPEKKKEFETGLEMKFFGNRLGFEANYYNNRIVDQILWLSVPKTVGASRMLTNIGELKNLGFEGSLYGTPFEGKDFRWDLRGNFAINRNQVVSLMEGVDQLVHSNIDAGAAKIVSEPGKPMGEIIAYLPMKNDNGDYIVDDNDGLYQIDFSEMKKVGNAMPKLVGGFGSYAEYKHFFVDFTIDYSWGGDIVSLSSQYMKGAGMFEETLQYRDAEHGGLSYYIDADGKKVQFDGDAGPGGEKVFHDGLILPGVKSDGSANDIIVSAADYYLNTFTWGANPAWGIPYSRYDDAVRKNHYVKFRELSVGYNLPKSLAQKFKCNNIRLALVGSNLFYLYRTFKDFDAETNIGTNWVNAAIVGGSTSASRSLGFSIRASF
ncbi:MAG: SusC/RagA family TonB-linked outer membrane protein [Bacteroidales bacterium]|nr:SusC/RagA family TonB-linked outer membrane protein [Bacteroidales bacterium]